MEITSRTEGNKVTMEISGWLDTQTAPKLEEEPVSYTHLTLPTT